MEKWNTKYDQVLKERADYKKRFLSSIKLSILNSNDNVASTFDPDVTLKNTLYTGGKLLPDHSEFKKVLARRRSRKSTRMPNVVDFDHVGNDVNAMNYLVDKSNLV
jgi:hypothetical protein